MRVQRVVCLLGATLAVLSISALAAAQDFQKSYSASPGTSINLRTSSGNITIVGSNGNQVVVSGYKEGRDRDMISVEDFSTAGRVDVRAKYPSNCHCNASLNFEVSAPQGVTLSFDNISTSSGNVEVREVSGNLNLRSSSGNVSVDGASGRIEASSSSGNVTVKNVSGSVSARTSSGNVNAHIIDVSGSDDMEFSSSSGNVRVWVPDTIDANVAISTSSGSLTSDFAIQMDGPVSGSSRSAHGQLGNGGRHLTISASSGDVSLKRQSPKSS
jgi:hypothetical protein